MIEGNNTLTESCECAENFMVIEREVDSLPKVPGEVVKIGFGRCGQAEGGYHQRRDFLLLAKTLDSTEGVPASVYMVSLLDFPRIDPAHQGGKGGLVGLVFIQISARRASSKR